MNADTPPPPQAFIENVASLAPIFCALPGGSEFRRPAAWQESCITGNDAVLATWTDGMALCAVTGERLAVVDVDPRNGGDVKVVAAALAGAGVEVYGEVDTPGGGRHFYVAGHAELPTCHRLDEFPGVDVQSHRAHVFLPGTHRPKYNERGYTVLMDRLEALQEVGDPASARNLVHWVTRHRAPSSCSMAAPVEPWDGTPPSTQTAAYVRAAVVGEADLVASTPSGGRNHQLYISALKLGGYVVGTGLPESVVVTALVDASRANGQLQEDGTDAVLATIRSGLGIGSKNPKAAPVRDPSGATTNEGVLPRGEETVVLGQQPLPLEITSAAQNFPRLDLTRLLGDERPPRDWVVEALLPAGASVALVAPAGKGKSLLLLAMALSVARGDSDFAGLAVKRRRVLLIDMENTEDDLAERLRDLGVTEENAHEINDLVLIHLPDRLRPLDTAGGGDDLESMIEYYALGPGDVVILDSFQRVIGGPENDSDTMRAFFRHSAARLKRRKLTLVRTDNTGKDAEKGARGSSGKRDDVDVELRLSVDLKRPGCLRIVPGKQRIPDVQPLTLQQVIDDSGRVSYDTAGDPHRARVAEVVALLDRLGLDQGAGERPAYDAIKRARHSAPREIVRAAVKTRKSRVCADSTPRT